MAKRAPPSGSQPQPSLPHDPDRKGGQPYAKEVEDYNGGIASAPTEQVEHDPDSRTKKTASSRE
jgi:hypothetical protein